jgi:nitroreductase
MELWDVIANRYSVRAYKPDAVEEEKLLRVLEAARLAPTAANRQPVQIVVVHTAGRETELRRVYNSKWFVQAPLALCVCGLPDKGWTRADGKNFTDIDVAIVMDHLILCAAGLGLGTCWIGAFNPAAAREVLQLPEGVEPIVWTPLGYPADQPRAKQRLELEELVRYERW